MARSARVLSTLLAVLVGLLATGIGPAAPALAATRPAVTKVGAGSGPLAPTTVVITGSHLKGANAVEFGSKRGTVLRATSSSSIQVRTPSGARAGTVAVRVRTKAGWSVSRARYTFVAAPALSRVAPAAGPLSGGGRITLTGTNLGTADRVLFNGAAGRVLAKAPSSVVVSAPRAARPGVVSVRVHTVGGWSPVTTRARFTFVAGPTLTAVGPSAGPLTGGQQVTLTGVNLSGTDQVVFDRLTATVLSRSAGAVVVRTPRVSAAGSVTVRLHTVAGWTAVTSATRYTYAIAPTLTGLSPASGSFAGGEKVTLTGTDLAAVSTVLFGTLPATVLERSATSVVVRTPVGVLGETTVSVTGAGGTSRAVAFTYLEPTPEDTTTLTPDEATFEPTAVDWVNGGYDPETGQANPWVVSLPRGSAVPAVGKPFLIRPGAAVFPSGLAGTVDDVAAQTDESIRVTVKPSDLNSSLKQLSIDYSGPVIDSTVGTGNRSADGAIEFPINGSSLFCRDQSGRTVSVHADMSMTVTDVDVSQHLDLGGVFSKPTYDATVTAEVTTQGKFWGEVASTCEVNQAWSHAMHRTIFLGTTGLTIGFEPKIEFSVSARGTFTFLDRTRTTFAVDAELGKTPQFSRTSRTVESRIGGALTFEAGLAAGVELQFGLLDRVGVQGSVMLGVTASLTASNTNVCIDAKLVLKLGVGLFLDVWVYEWESPKLTATIDLYTLFSRCVVAEPSDPPADEPVITSTRLTDARLGSPYDASLETADHRSGTWSIVRYALPAGLSLDAGSGRISGTPTAAVGDYPMIVDFTDAGGQVATTAVRIRVQPSTGIGGGDIQVTIRWTGPADLDLHVVDPANEEIYYGNPTAGSGGQLDHDANAGCNGAADDDNAVENVFWPPRSAPAGNYLAWVQVYAACDGPLDWHLTIRRNGVVILDETGTGTSAGHAFTVGDSRAKLALRQVPTRTYPSK